MATLKINQKKKLSVVEKKYFKDLHAFVDEVFNEAADHFDWSWNQLANNSDLAHATVSNLGNRITRYPRYYTIWKLARAVGMNLVLQAPTKRAAAGIRRAA